MQATYFPMNNPGSIITLALATKQFPLEPSHPPITAIIRISPERARELLALMKDISAFANYSSTAFRVSSFERRAIYVPTKSLPLHFRPEPDNFIVLEPGYKTTDLSPVKIIHADVLPFTVSWAARDLYNRFSLDTSELDSRVLVAIGAQLSISPGSTSSAFTGIRQPPIPPLIRVPKYSDFLN